MHIPGSKFTLLGKAIEVKKDISGRMGITSPTLDRDTKYIIYKKPLSEEQENILKTAKRRGISCIELGEYLNLTQ